MPKFVNRPQSWVTDTFISLSPDSWNLHLLYVRIPLHKYVRWAWQEIPLKTIRDEVSEASTTESDHAALLQIQRRRDDTTRHSASAGWGVPRCIWQQKTRVWITAHVTLWISSAVITVIFFNITSELLLDIRSAVWVGTKTVIKAWCERLGMEKTCGTKVSFPLFQLGANSFISPDCKKKNMLIISWHLILVNTVSQQWLVEQIESYFQYISQCYHHIIRTLTTSVRLIPLD